MPLGLPTQMESFMQTIKIAFSDFWGTFEPTNNYFWHLLRKYSGQEVVLDYNNPDLVIYSVFGENHRKYTGCCPKIRFSGESHLESDYAEQCDLSLSFQSGGPKQYRLPLWVLYIDWFNTGHPGLVPYAPLFQDRTYLLKYKQPDKFCNFIYNNPAEGSPRQQLFHEISKYKRVDSYGRLFNNMGILGGNESTKLMIQRQYQFSLALENICSPGYVTEKLLHALVAGTIPIYWGDKAAYSDFNPLSYYWATAAVDIDIEFIPEFIKIFDCPEGLTECFSEPIFFNNKINPAFEPHSVWGEIKKCLLI